MCDSLCVRVCVRMNTLYNFAVFQCFCKGAVHSSDMSEYKDAANTTQVRERGFDLSLFVPPVLMCAHQEVEKNKMNTAISVDQ